MTPFERAAVFTMIETIEAQLKGLKNLISVAAGKQEHKTTNTIAPEENFLSEDEDRKLADRIEAERKARAEKLAREAQDVFTNELQNVAGGVPLAELNG